MDHEHSPSGQKDSNNCLYIYIYIYIHTILKMIPRFMKKRIKKRNQTRKNKHSRTKSKGGNDEIKTQHIRILQECLNEFITTEEDYCKTLISAIRFTTKLQTNKSILLIDAIQKESTIQGIQKKFEDYNWKGLPTKEHLNFFFLDIIYTLVHNKKYTLVHNQKINHIKKLLCIKKDIFTTYGKIINFGSEFEKLKPIVEGMSQIQLLSSPQTDTSQNADKKTPILSSSLIDNNVCEKKTLIIRVLNTFIATLQELLSIADCYEGYPVLHASITEYIKLYQEHIAQTKKKQDIDISGYVIDILIRPIQRWLRYILLCENLLKYIPQYTDIQQQLGILINNLKNIAVKMNKPAPKSTRKSRRKHQPIGVRQWLKKLRTRKKNAVVPIESFRNGSSGSNI